jgi:hypothetical protein
LCVKDLSFSFSFSLTLSLAAVSSSLARFCALFLFRYRVCAAFSHRYFHARAQYKYLGYVWLINSSSLKTAEDELREVAAVE